MKKIFSKILIAVFVLSIFLAPFSPNITNKNNEISFKIEKNEINAQMVEKWVYSWKSVLGFDNFEYFSSELACTTHRLTNNFNGLATPCIKVENTEAKFKEIQEEFNKDYFGCSAEKVLSWFTNCIVSLVYYIIYQPISYLAGLAARILDFFVYYSIDDNSYRTNFIDLGWSIIRDIANVFFIIALLYVAIKTIVDLNSSDNKKLIIKIIAIALIINFSLFATKVVIDASNMLAHIFYANIESIGKNGEKLDPTYKGEKSITVGLVRQFDPQKIFGEDNKIDQDGELSTFAIILIIGIALAGYMFFMFLSVALFFISRVIMLWLLMIFSPIAFASYTIPSISIPGFGGKEWWSELSKNAFLAPVFIFFLYLIIMFGDISKVVTGTSIDDATTSTITGQNTMDFMKVIIPFLLVFVLLMKLKTIATKMAGEMGAAIVKGAQVVGGVALGAASGAVAMTARKTIGAGAAAIKAGGSSIAEGPTGKFMQKWGPLRELRNFSTFNWAKLGKPKDKNEVTDKEVQKPELKTVPGTTTKTSTTSSDEHEKLIEGYENRKEEVERTETRKELGERLEELKGGQVGTGYTTSSTGAGNQVYEMSKSKSDLTQEAVSGAPMANIGNITIAGPVAISGKDVTLNSESLKGGAGGEEKGKEGESKEENKGEETKTDEVGKPKIATVQSARTLKDKVAEGKFGAKQAYQAADFLSKSSFDVRNTKLGQMFSKYTGINMGTMLLGADKGKGGYEGVNARKIAKDQAFALEIAKPSGLEVAKLNMLHVDLLKMQDELAVAERNGESTEKKAEIESRIAVAQAKYSQEGDRLDNITSERLGNYATVISERGGFGLMSKMGFYSPVNLEIAKNIMLKAPITIVKKKLKTEDTNTKLILEALNQNQQNKT